jgi:hypothetical protein
MKMSGPRYMRRQEIDMLDIRNELETIKDQIINMKEDDRTVNGERDILIILEKLINVVIEMHKQQSRNTTDIMAKGM